MSAILKQLATKLRAELYKRHPKIIGQSGRFPKRQLFLAFNECKPILEEKFGGPVTSRWSVGKKWKPKETKILEYLVDYGICRYSIPEAIRQHKADKPKPELQDTQFYEILLGVESELGNDDEVLRDFLKLLDIKSRIKCLVFYRRSDDHKAEALYERINWVVSHHNSFDSEEGFLFVGLPKPEKATLTDDIEFKCLKDKKVAPLE